MLRLTPKASRNALGPVAQDGDGNSVLKAQVTAVPEGGKANAALIKLVAKSLGLPKGAISLKRGLKSRIKTLFIDIGASDIGPEELLKRLSEGLCAKQASSTARRSPPVSEKKLRPRSPC